MMGGGGNQGKNNNEADKVLTLLMKA